MLNGEEIVLHLPAGHTAGIRSFVVLPIASREYDGIVREIHLHAVT